MDGAGLSAGAVARRLGVAVTTLRAWHQRYGLGPTRHEPGQHRRYGDDDLARLETMRRLTAQGVPAAEAARVALAPPPVSTPAPAPVPAPVLPGGARVPSAGRTTPDARVPPAGRTTPGARAALALPPVPPRRARAGGGHAIPVGRAGPEARGLAAAAMRLDEPTMRTVIGASVTGRGVVRTWDEMLRPVLVGVGRRYATTHRLVEVEHLLSRCITEVFGAVPRPGSGAAPRVLLACADEEQHSLPLEALAAALAERGVGCRLLGARVPRQALRDAVRRTGPTAVLLWSHAPATADAAQLEALAGGRRRPAVIAAAGPGWPEPLLEGVLRPTSLSEAVTLTGAV